MFFASIAVDLPHEPYPVSTGLKRLLSFFRSDGKEGRRKATIEALAVFERLLRALETGGFTDIIRVMIDSKPLFVDEDGVDDDVQQALHRAVASGELVAGFSTVCVVASRQDSQMHHLVDVEFDEDVRMADHEITLRWSSRSVALRVQHGETPADYRERIRAAARDGVLGEHAVAVAAHVARFRESLQGLEPLRVTCSNVSGRIVVPGPVQIGRLRHLGFGRSVRPRVYRPHPTLLGRGAYEHAHVHHFYDPYHDLLSWILVSEARARTWKPTGFEFVRPDGQPVDVMSNDASVLGVPLDAVVFRDQRIEVDPSMPEVGFHPSEAGSPHAPGWGGDAPG